MQPDIVVDIEYGMPKQTAQVVVGTISVRDNFKILKQPTGISLMEHVLGSGLDCIKTPENMDMCALPLPVGRKVFDAFWAVNGDFFDLVTPAAETASVD